MNKFYKVGRNLSKIFVGLFDNKTLESITIR